MSDVRTLRAFRDLSDRALLSFFNSWQWLRGIEGRVTIDLREAEFIAPWALTQFGLYALWLKEVKGCEIEVLLDPDSIAGRYVTRAGFLRLLNGAVGGTGERPDPYTTPLVRVSSSKEVPTVARSLTNLLGVDDNDLRGAINYAVVELLRNVVQHSASEVGGVVMGQYFPSTGLVEVAVADAGMGIRSSLKGRYPEIRDDKNALKMATLPHVSGTFDPAAYSRMSDNAGLGLFFIKEIAVRGAGGFFLGSEKYMVNHWGGNDGSPHKRYSVSTMSGWRGTFAVLQLHRRNIADFGSLLEMCRQLAARAREDFMEQQLDFISEVDGLSEFKTIKVAEFEEDTDEAARVREETVIPALRSGEPVVLDFDGIQFATQSFVHAFLYKVLKDDPSSLDALTFARCTNSTEQSVRAVAAYARSELDQ